MLQRLSNTILRMTLDDFSVLTGSPGDPFSPGRPGKPYT